MAELPVVATKIKLPARYREIITQAAAREHRSVANFLVAAALEKIERQSK